MPASPLQIRFDRGTLLIRTADSEGATLPGVLWDPRVSSWRAAAHHYAAILSHARARGLEITDDVEASLEVRAAAWRPPPLRGYQEDALRAWRGLGARGLVVLPTGSGKTRVAIAAMADAGKSSLVLCPTRALLEQWEQKLAEWYDGPVGVVGDGARRIEAVTVMTFESAYRQLDTWGDRFGLLVVDEAHHFAGGLRAEALEMCAAPRRLGLTATAPERGSAGAARLSELIGPVSCEVGFGELAGTHLARLDMTTLGVGLDAQEEEAYRRHYGRFAELRAAFVRANPGVDWIGCLRALAATQAGRSAISGYHRAVAIASFPCAKRALTAALIERHRRDKTLIFTARTDDAYAISRAHLVPLITADTPRAERKDILARFSDGRYRAIVSARVLNEGLDVPDANVAILVGGTLGAREHLQRIGRVLRPAPGGRENRASAYELVTRGTIDDARARATARARRAGGQGRDRAPARAPFI